MGRSKSFLKRQRLGLILENRLDYLIKFENFELKVVKYKKLTGTNLLPEFFVLTVVAQRKSSKREIEVITKLIDKREKCKLCHRTLKLQDSALLS